MEHARALLIKFVMVTAAVWLVLGLFYGADFGEILTISILLTIAAYLIGDLFILPRYGNLSATVADFGLAYIGIWLIGSMIINENISLGWASFWTAAVIAIAEYFFHSYLASQGHNEENDQRTVRTEPAYTTEMAEETDIHKEDR
ncbi:YndM family protein [Bacillus thermotolerans]|uniref:Integral membrane protein n=1 Tax=Bacillus thermotolerans TaxID=1221996 RepID=A0A0F5I7B8_BACTR|nr:YndM family protein [Bacillus thermotolerans]KKB34061.1 Integral membrane protein [Bacillus thermotolerans]KKB34777.1 Integral membrane protein [Bacillus thermotolerans]KKB41514.1 Integral membrane protein [Bacillus thermotolerans]